MRNLNELETSCNTSYVACPAFSWSAIFSGLFTATAIGALFSLLGIAIGLALFKPDSDVISNLSIGALVWFIVGGTVAMFIGGIITGYVAPTRCRTKGMIHGLVMWSFSFILSLLLTISGAGSVLTGSGQLVSRSISISGQVASSAITPIASQVADTLNLTENKSLAKIAKQANDLVSKAAKKAAATAKEEGRKAVLQSSDESQEQLIETIKNFVTNTNDELSQQLYDKALTQLTESTGLSRHEAEQLLNKWQESYQKVADKTKEKVEQVKAQAKDAVNYTSNVLSVVTFSAFIAMVLGALASIWGSMLGVKWHRD